MKKFIAEFIGTFTLVFAGCGTAMLVGCDYTFGCGYLLTALAFGLTIVAMAYSIGNVSGCHINPAVSIAVFINNGMTIGEFVVYFIAQLMGAFAGSGVLALIFHEGNLLDMTGGYATNGLAGVNGSVVAGLAVEAIFTFIFVLVILGVTSKKANHGSFAGLVIGLSLVLIHIASIGLTGTSVNPARSFGPAIVSTIIMGSGSALTELWVFFVGPFVGAILAALVHKYFESGKED